MDSTFTILGLTAHAYGLCASAAAFVLLGGMAILAHRRRMPAGLTGLFGLLSIPLGIVCARALYCVFHLSDFWETYENPWLMLRFFDGGLAMPGLLAGARAGGCNQRAAGEGTPRRCAGSDVYSAGPVHCPFAPG